MKSGICFLLPVFCGFVFVTRVTGNRLPDEMISGMNGIRQTVDMPADLFVADTFRMPNIKIEVKKDAQGRTVIDTAQFKQAARTYKAQYEQQLSAFFVGKPFPDFALPDPSGKVWKNSDLKGKVTLINTWKISCRPCKKEMPALNELMKNYPDYQFWAISPNTSREIKEIVENTPFHFTQLTEEKQFLDDNHLTAFPVDLIIDKKGIVRFVLYGGDAETHKRLKDALDRMNAE